MARRELASRFETARIAPRIGDGVSRQRHVSCAAPGCTATRPLLSHLDTHVPLGCYRHAALDPCRSDSSPALRQNSLATTAQPTTPKSSRRTFTCRQVLREELEKRANAPASLFSAPPRDKLDRRRSPLDHLATGTPGGATDARATGRTPSILSMTL